MNLKRIKNSFKNAGEGIFYTVRTQPNFKFHIAVSLLVLASGVYFSISKMEWLFVVSSIGIVLLTEVLNTAIEELTNLVTKEFHPLAKLAKDCAAGAVLLAATTAAIIGIIIFLPYVKHLITG